VDWAEAAGKEVVEMAAEVVVRVVEGTEAEATATEVDLEAEGTAAAMEEEEAAAGEECAVEDS
jgi:hypothetical protein